MRSSLENALLLSVVAVLFGILVLVFPDEVGENAYAMIFSTPIAVASIMAFALSYKYKRVPKFCVGHIFLGLSMLFYVLAEIIWIIFYNWDYEQYPSIIDIFYTLYFAFAIFHPISILRFFDAKPKRIHYGIMVTLISIPISTYVLFTEPLEGMTVWWAGFHFIGMSSTLLAVAIFASIVLRNRQVFKFWFIIAIAFVVNCVADFHYYSIENYMDWSKSDFVNVMWFASSMILIYALIQHRRMYHAIQE